MSQQRLGAFHVRVPRVFMNEMAELLRKSNVTPKI